MPATTPAAFDRNRWPLSIGTRGRVQSESLAAIVGIRSDSIEQLDRAKRCGFLPAVLRIAVAGGHHGSRGVVGLVSAYGEVSKPDRGAASANPWPVWLNGPRRQHAGHTGAECVPFGAPGGNHAGVWTILPGLSCSVGSHQSHQEKRLVLAGREASIWVPRDRIPDHSSTRCQQAGTCGDGGGGQKPSRFLKRSTVTRSGGC
jgi:hypothetical protein